jgi:hypothetical protein
MKLLDAFPLSILVVFIISHEHSKLPHRFLYTIYKLNFSDSTDMEVFGTRKHYIKTMSYALTNNVQRILITDLTATNS